MRPLTVVPVGGWLRGLCSFMSLRAIPAGALAPGRATEVGKSIQCTSCVVVWINANHEG